MLPLHSTHYSVAVCNNFASIKSTQIYRNPFLKALEIHYSVPTDPSFIITELKVFYKDAVVQGLVKEK
jgi:hypothetical protein